MPSNVKFTANPAAAEQRQAEAAKIARLRALRLAKEVADREAATAAAADILHKTARRVRSPNRES